MGFFDHIVKKQHVKRQMQGKMERKRRRGRPAMTCFQDLKKKMDNAGHGGFITTGDGSGNRQSHRSTDTATS